MKAPLSLEGPAWENATQAGALFKSKPRIERRTRWHWEISFSLVTDVFE